MPAPRAGSRRRSGTDPDRDTPSGLLDPVDEHTGKVRQENLKTVKIARRA
jgi:hypothetical protein